jgi:hypothetical protein
MGFNSGTNVVQIKKFLNNFQNDKLVIPAMLLLLVLLAYGLLTPWLGFYWDDWPFAWLLHFFGSTEFIEAFRAYRPFLGPIFAVTTALFGGEPFTWQLVGLAVRFLLSLELWFVLRAIWPSQKWNVIWVVLLFTVYPGYQQQWVSLTHVNQELIPLLWLIASFGVSAWALRNERYRKSMTVIALVLQALGLFSTEYFFGLEILRFFFLMVIISETVTLQKEIIRKTCFHWLPYFCVWMLNAAWTYIYHHSAAYNSYDIPVFSSLFLSPLALVNEVLTTFSLSGLSSWLNTFQIFSTIDGTLTQLASLAILLFSAFAIYMYMRFAYKSIQPLDSVKDDRWGLQAAGIGLVAIFAGRLPSWAAGLPLKLEFDYDRFMLSIMLGASLFIVGLATFILKDGKRKIIILSMIIGLSTAYQFSISNAFRRDRDNQRAFLWQLAWRIPAMKNGTVLLTYELPLKYVSDLQITAPINWIYAPSLSIRELPYVLLYIKSRINSAILPSLKPHTPIQLQYRTVGFRSTTSNSVVIYKQADGCLRVLDQVYGNAQTLPGASYFLLDAIPLSDPNQIQANAPQPVLDNTLFGIEPAHDWCYFYEKAELARQQSDWGQVVKLFNQAQKAGQNVSMPVEYLPFIEGFAMNGQTETALKLTDRTLTAQKELCAAVHSLWDRVLKTSSLQTLQASDINARIRQGGCKP